jgi:hypothetical protein
MLPIPCQRGAKSFICIAQRHLAVDVNELQEILDTLRKWQRPRVDCPAVVPRRLLEPIEAHVLRKQCGARFEPPRKSSRMAVAAWPKSVRSAFPRDAKDRMEADRQQTVTPDGNRELKIDRRRVRVGGTRRVTRSIGCDRR